MGARLSGGGTGAATPFHCHGMHTGHDLACRRRYGVFRQFFRAVL
jgi:hypothetical protein